MCDLLNFLQPLHHPNFPTIGQRIVEACENMLWLGRSFKTVLSDENGVLSVKQDYNNENCLWHYLKVAAKVAAYCTVIIPVICLAVKVIYRLNLQIREVKEVSPKDFKELQDILQGLEVIKTKVQASNTLSEEDRKGVHGYIYWLSYFSDLANAEKIHVKAKGAEDIVEKGKIGVCAPISANYMGGDFTLYINFEKYTSWDDYFGNMQTIARDFLISYHRADQLNRLDKFLSFVASEVRNSDDHPGLEQKHNVIQNWANDHLIINFKP